MAAVVFRVDTWPLTWVPMYAAYEPVTDIRIREWNRDDLRRGFLATTLDGHREYITYQQLNIPRTKFIRLYYERMFGFLPGKEARDNFALSAMNRRLRELAGTYPSRKPPWEWRILNSLNRSLHRKPGRPDFIVTLEATALERQFSMADLSDGGGVRPEARLAVATASWKPQWREVWNDEQR